MLVFTYWRHPKDRVPNKNRSVVKLLPWAAANKRENEKSWSIKFERKWRRRECLGSVKRKNREMRRYFCKLKVVSLWLYNLWNLSFRFCLIFSFQMFDWNLLFLVYEFQRSGLCHWFVLPVLSTRWRPAGVAPAAAVVSQQPRSLSPALHESERLPADGVQVKKKSVNMTVWIVAEGNMFESSFI